MWLNVAPGLSGQQQPVRDGGCISYHNCCGLNQAPAHDKVHPDGWTSEPNKETNVVPRACSEICTPLDQKAPSDLQRWCVVVGSLWALW